MSTQIAAGVLLSWTLTVYGQFQELAGKSAPHEFLQLIIYKATTFSNEIEKIDTVRAYHVRSLLLSPHADSETNDYPLPEWTCKYLVIYYIDEW